MPYLRRATDAPFGLMPYSDVLRLREYSKLTSTPAIFAGDILLLNSSGQLAPITGTRDVPVIGVAARSFASGSTGVVPVYDHPEQLYTCQEDSVGTAMAQTNVGNMADPTGLTPGTAAQVTRNRSITQLDMSTAGVVNGMLQIVGLHEVESGFPSASGNPRKVIVKINGAYHYFATQSSGV